jgi:hypothetical protein
MFSVVRTLQASRPRLRGGRQRLREEDHVVVAKIDCDVEAKEEVRRLRHLRIPHPQVKDNKDEKYEGARNIDAFVTYINKAGALGALA